MDIDLASFFFSPVDRSCTLHISMTIIVTLLQRVRIRGATGDEGGGQGARGPCCISYFGLGHVLSYPSYYKHTFAPSQNYPVALLFRMHFKGLHFSWYGGERDGGGGASWTWVGIRKKIMLLGLKSGDYRT